MHDTLITMMNPFPIQFLALFAYFILRIFLASILLYLGYKHLKYRNELKQILRFSWFPFGAFATYVFAFGELVLGGLLFVGAQTQIAALFVFCMSLKMLIFRKKFKHHSIPQPIFYILLIAVSLSLIITGAGVFAFDLPL